MMFLGVLIISVTSLLIAGFRNKDLMSPAVLVKLP